MDIKQDVVTIPHAIQYITSSVPLISIRQDQVSKNIPTYPRAWDYLNLGNIDRIPNIKGYPKMS